MLAAIGATGNVFEFRLCYLVSVIFRICYVVVVISLNAYIQNMLCCFSHVIKCTNYHTTLVILFNVHIQNTFFCCFSYFIEGIYCNYQNIQNDFIITMTFLMYSVSKLNFTSKPNHTLLQNHLNSLFDINI